MQKQVRIIKQGQGGTSIVYGIALKKEIAIFAEGIFYEAKWENGNILLESGTNVKPDNKQIESYEFENCKVGENEDSKEL